MNVIDISIIIFILFGGILGFKRGFTKQLLSFVGVVGIIILAFILKNYVSVFMYENLPFFPFGGYLKGVTVLNIALYEMIAFFLVLAVLIFIFRILLFASGIFESILNFTIILGIPSKILGALLGMLEVYAITFIILYILSLPTFSISVLNDSIYKDKILNNTPLLSGYVSKSMSVFNEFAILKDKYEGASNAKQFNYDTLDLFLKYQVVTVDSVKILDEKNKIQIDNLSVLIKKYEED